MLFTSSHTCWQLSCPHLCCRCLPLASPPAPECSADARLLATPARLSARGTRCCWPQLTAALGAHTHRGSSEELASAVRSRSACMALQYGTFLMACRSTYSGPFLPCVVELGHCCLPIMCCWAQESLHCSTRSQDILQG